MTLIILLYNKITSIKWNAILKIKFLLLSCALIPAFVFATTYNDGGNHTISANGSDTSWNLSNSTTLNYSGAFTFSVPNINIFGNSVLNITNNSTVNISGKISLKGAGSTLNIQDSTINYGTNTPLTTQALASGNYHITINNSQIFLGDDYKFFELNNVILSINHSHLNAGLQLKNSDVTIANSTIDHGMLLRFAPSTVTLTNVTLNYVLLILDAPHAVIRGTNVNITPTLVVPAIIYDTTNATLNLNGGSIMGYGGILISEASDINDTNYEFYIQNMDISINPVATFSTGNYSITYLHARGAGIVNVSNSTVVPYIFDNITINMTKDSQAGIYTDAGHVYIGTTNDSYSKILDHGFTPVGGLIIGLLPAYYSPWRPIPHTSLVKIIGKLDAEGHVYVYDKGQLQLGDSSNHVGYIKGNVYLEGNNGLNVYTSGAITNFDYTPYTQDHLFHQEGSVIDGNLFVDGQTNTLFSQGNGGLFIVTGNITNANDPVWDFSASSAQHLVVGKDYSGNSTIHMLWDPLSYKHSSMFVIGNVSGTHHLNIDFLTPPHQFFSNYLIKVNGDNTATFHVNHQNAGPLLYTAIQQNITFKSEGQPDLNLTNKDIFLALLETDDDRGLCLTYNNHLYCEHDVSLDDFLKNQGINPDDVIADGSVLLYKPFFMPLLINPYVANFKEHRRFYKHPRVSVNFDAHTLNGSPWLTNDFSLYRYVIDASLPVLTYANPQSTNIISDTSGGEVFFRFQNITSSTGFIRSSIYPVLGTIWSISYWHVLWDAGLQGGYLRTKVNLPLGGLLTGDSSANLNSWTGATHVGMGVKLFDALKTQFIIHDTLSYDYIGGQSVKLDELKSILPDDTVTIDPTHIVKDRLYLDMNTLYNIGLRTYIGQQFVLGSTLHIPPTASVHLPLNSFYYGVGLHWTFHHSVFNIDYDHHYYDQRVSVGFSVLMY